jgi:small subunit ribosomal protein S20
VANLPSVEKRHRQSLKRRARNTTERTKVKGAVKKLREAITAKDAAKAKDALKAATKVLDMAASKRIITKANASRRIGRLAHAVHALSAPAKAAAPAAPAKS